MFDQANIVKEILSRKKEYLKKGEAYAHISACVKDMFQIVSKYIS